MSNKIVTNYLKIWLWDVFMTGNTTVMLFWNVLESVAENFHDNSRDAVMSSRSREAANILLLF